MTTAAIDVNALVEQAEKIEGMPVLLVEGERKVIDTGKDLELPSGRIVRNQTVAQIVTRLTRIFPQPYNDAFKLKRDDFYTVVEVVLSMGLNPMLPGVHYHAWKGKPNELTVMKHYTVWRNWLKYVDSDAMMFSETFEECEITNPDSKWLSKTAIVPSSRLGVFLEEKRGIYKILVESDVAPREALRLAAFDTANLLGTVRSGVVEHEEIYEKDGQGWKPRKSHTPKGWETGVDRAMIRSGTNAIKDAIGTPSFFDTIAFAFGQEAPAEVLPEMALETDDNMARSLDFDGARRQMGQIVVQKGFGKRR